MIIVSRWLRVRSDIGRPSDHQAGAIVEAHVEQHEIAHTTKLG